MPFSINPFLGLLLCQSCPVQCPSPPQHPGAMPEGTGNSLMGTGSSWKPSRFPLAESPGRHLGFEFPERGAGPAPAQCGFVSGREGRHQMAATQGMSQGMSGASSCPARANSWGKQRGWAAREGLGMNLPRSSRWPGSCQSSPGWREAQSRGQGARKVGCKQTWPGRDLGGF